MDNMDNYEYDSVVAALPQRVRTSLHILEMRGDIIIRPGDEFNKPRIGPGYKNLVRWARKQCGYTTRLSNDDVSGNIVVRCQLMRNDALPLFNAFVAAGADFDAAYTTAAVQSVGIVTADEQQRTIDAHSGKVNEPPTGWDWRQVAQKRAITNAISLAYGQPTLDEMLAEASLADGEETIESDWRNDDPPQVRTRMAAARARARAARARVAEMSDDEIAEMLAHNVALLRGGGEEI